MNISALEIRNKFLSFFRGKDHLEITDSSVVPKNDPTLLFINSGMAPLKNYFTGVEKPPYKRLCDVQPCIRTIDIDSIGDKHHLTSFQMLGSWSINDYFKEKAIALAFEFLTSCLQIPKEKLYVTVFAGDGELGLPLDTEAYECWKNVGMPESHIIACGKDDNFWGPTAETGPCGPCTEIFYDTGDGEEYVPGGEFDTKKRYIEIWNAGVFMQLNKNSDGTYSKLSFTSVDTGAGLERLAMVLNGYSSAYETDLLAPIKKLIETQCENYCQLPEQDARIITDHLRTVTLILSENVKPSNEGRGYIPRKLIRRCMMILAKNKVENFNFVSVIELIVENYKEMFKKFAENKNYIVSEFKKEEEQFAKVLENGLVRLEQIKSSCKSISGEEAFDLVTTYGLPFDIIAQYALENDIQIDEADYQNKLKEHKEKSKSVAKGSSVSNIKNLADKLGNVPVTEFLGYDASNCQAKILKIIKNEEVCEQVAAGDEAVVVFDRTVFYAQSGGQCADIGLINCCGAKLMVTDVQKTAEGVFVHFCTVEEGMFKLGDTVNMQIDSVHRLQVANAHTAVHLLQSALQQIYGKNLHQAGSKVEPSKLRFDFNCDEQINFDNICEIERLVNSYIMQNIKREVEVKKLSDAISDGAMAIFESKYGDDVRVVKFGDVSLELCGGTHTSQTGNIGVFAITSVEGIGKGLKRITAVVSDEALSYFQNRAKLVDEISKKLKAKPFDIISKIEKEFSKKTEKSLERAEITEKNVELIKTNSGAEVAYIAINEPNKKLTNDVAKISDKLKKIVVCVAGTDKKQVVVAINDQNSNKFYANELISKIMSNLGGKGGGNKKIATGGTDKSKQEVKNAAKSAF